MGLGSGAESTEPERPVEGTHAGGGKARTWASGPGESLANKPEITSTPKIQGGKESEEKCLKSQEETRGGSGEEESVLRVHGCKEVK